jgi:glycosyltransferase involved in cell wall biosynthesis
VRVFAGHDGGSGCAYYRMELPLRELERHDGFDVTWADSGDRMHPPSITLSMLGGHDVIVAQRWNTHKGLEIWRRARTPYSRLVYETDDDVFSITQENWQAYQLYSRPDIRDAVEHAAAVADLVTVSTEPLAQVMREFNPNVAVLPNCIPARMLDLPRYQMRPRPRVGWMGAASHGIDIGQVAGPVRRFLKRFPGWDLQVNATDYRETFKAPDDRMFFRPWVQVNENPDKFFGSIDFDIGLCPLWPTGFSRSKSAIKAIEYGARGIPVVASDCEAYRAVIEHGVSGFLVRYDHEWLRYMSELAGDDGLRAKMGEAARAMAARHTIEEHWRRWADAYESLFPAR